MIMRIELPMRGRPYVVTVSEQKYLSCRHEVSADDLEAMLLELKAELEKFPDEVQKTAGRVKRQIASFVESRKATRVRAR